MGDESLETTFKRLLVEHGGAVVKVARAYTVTAEDGRDLAQEILLQVWRSLPRFEGRADAATWMYRVALNTAIGWKRKERRREAGRGSELRVEELSSDGADAAEDAALRETVERLYAAIRRLNKADAAIVLLSLDGLSYRQIAEVLGISESHVGVKLNRARKALGELMGEGDREP